MANFIKNSEYGDNQEKLPIDFDPSQYTTCEEAAKAFHKALIPVVAAYGQDPDIECGIYGPKEAAGREYGPVWVVWWEAGPYEWAIPASMEFMRNAKAGWFTEPHYSFDLTFTE
jgi:hypothetical protein